MNVLYLIPSNDSLFLFDCRQTTATKRKSKNQQWKNNIKLLLFQWIEFIVQFSGSIWMTEHNKRCMEKKRKSVWENSIENQLPEKIHQIKKRNRHKEKFSPYFSVIELQFFRYFLFSALPFIGTFIAIALLLLQHAIDRSEFFLPLMNFVRGKI